MNNQKILLISETYVKNFSSVMDNVENKFIKSHILEAQNNYIQNILGSPLYENVINEFIGLMVSGGTTGVTSDYVSAINITLVNDYIQPTLLYYVLYDSMIDFATKMTNKGFVTQSSTENSAPADIAYFNIQRKGFKDKAEQYAEKMMKYLIQNMNTYTLYRDWSGGVDEIRPIKNNFHAGIYLGPHYKDYNIITPNGPECI